MKRLRTCAPALAMLLVLALTALAYMPGLHGGFLFDDFGNLPALGAFGPVDNIATFWRYITSGTADPTGRPIALLSFLLDAHDWPAQPAPFKYTSLQLHLLNGLLLAFLLRRLGQAWLCGTATDESMHDKLRRRMAWAAVLGSALWLLHPLFVSTTLYIVQREAMLPVLFTLLGLLFWLQGRHAMAQGRTIAGVAWISLGLVGCTMLATLSKANGVLLPALALTIEFAYLRPLALASTPHDRRAGRLYSGVMFLLAGIPTALLTSYLLYRGWHGMSHGISAARPWTLGQRLLTEPRVLVDYLQLLWLPRPFTPGLFNDQISASTGLWSPASTLPSLLAIIALIGASIGLRKRLPAVALAILFFFVGQSLESSTIPLELYFEHRNYLPAMLMFWPLALWLCDVPGTVPSVASRGSSHRMTSGTRRRLKSGLAIVLLIGLAGMTHARAALWGNTHDQALLWATLNPASPRALANAAQAEMVSGYPARAATRLRPALANNPDELQLALNLLGAECQMGHITNGSLQAALVALRTTRNPGSLLEHWFERALQQSAHPPCPEMNLATIGDLLAATQANARLMSKAGRRQDIHHLQGKIALLENQPDLALSEFNLALDQQVRAAVALRQAAQFGATGYPELGVAHLDHYHAVHLRERAPGHGMARVHHWVLDRQHYWDKELVRLRNTLLADQQAKDHPSR